MKVKKNYPANIINADKSNFNSFRPIKSFISIEKYQNSNNIVYGLYKPISKIFKLNE